MKMELTSLWQMWDHSSHCVDLLSKISEQRFQHLVEFVSQKIKAEGKRY